MGGMAQGVDATHSSLLTSSAQVPCAAQQRLSEPPWLCPSSGLHTDIDTDEGSGLLTAEHFLIVVRVSEGPRKHAMFLLVLFSGYACHPVGPSVTDVSFLTSTLNVPALRSRSLSSGQGLLAQDISLATRDPEALWLGVAGGGVQEEAGSAFHFVNKAQDLGPSWLSFTL